MANYVRVRYCILGLSFLLCPSMGQLCGSPKHVHLAVGKSSSTSMTVSFASPSCKNPAVIPTGAVLYGTNSEQLDRIATAHSPRRYNAEIPHHTTNTTTPYTSDHLHHVQIEGLEPNTKYYYRCTLLPGDFEAERIIEDAKKDEEGEEEAHNGRYLRNLVPSMLSPSNSRKLYTTTRPANSTMLLASDGQQLNTQESVFLPSFGVFLKMQGDGNLVLYKKQGKSNGGALALWAVKTHLGHGEYHTTLHRDGTLVIRKGVHAEPGPVLWTSNRSGAQGNYFLSYISGRYDFLGIITGTPEDPGELIWSTSDKGKAIRLPPTPPAGKGSFTTAPNPGEGRVKLVFMGDMSQTQRTEDTLYVLNHHRDKYSAIILAGDLSYPHSDQRRWDSWFDLMDKYDVFSDLPLQIAAGNHDIDIDVTSSEIFVAYEERFLMPQVREAVKSPYTGEEEIYTHKVPYPLPYEYGNSYYSFIYGPSHNLVINSYADFNPGSLQYDWIVNELTSVNRTLTPWLLVTMHCPMYNTFAFHRHDIQIKKGKEILEPLFIEYKVNVVFAGHIHAYMRTHPVVNDTVDESGPINIIIGDGGRQAKAPFWQATPEEWVAVRDATYFGYGTFDMINKTHAEWDWIHTAQGDTHNYVLSMDGEELPSVVGKDNILVGNQYFL